MAKDYIIDGGTGELDVGGNTLANRFDLPEVMVPQNLGQRYNIGGLVRQDYSKGEVVEQIFKTDIPVITKTLKDLYKRIVPGVNKKPAVEPFNPDDITSPMIPLAKGDMEEFIRYKITNNDWNDIELYKVFKDYTTQHHKGNASAASKVFGDVYKVKSKPGKQAARGVSELLLAGAKKRGWEDYKPGAGKWGQAIEGGVDIEFGDINTLADLTTKLQKEPNFIRDRITKLVEEKKINPDGAYDTTDILKIMGLKFDEIQRSQVKKHFVSPYKLGSNEGKRNNIPVRTEPSGHGKMQLYNLNDVVTNIESHAKFKPVPGASKTSAAVMARKNVLEDFDWDMYGQTVDSVLMGLNSRKTSLFSQIPDTALRTLLTQKVPYNIGHQTPVSFMQPKTGFEIAKIPKNKNKLYGLNSLVFQDKYVNHDILSYMQGKDQSLMKTINDFLTKNKGKKVDDALSKQIKKINIGSNTIAKAKRQRINDWLNEVYVGGKNKKMRRKHEPYLEGQQNTIGKLLLDLKKGDTIKLTDIVMDVSEVDPKFFLGGINKINSKANKISDLKPKELEQYKQNLIQQFDDWQRQVTDAAGFKDEGLDISEYIEGGIHSDPGPNPSIPIVGEAGQISFAQGGVVPRIEYRDGTRMSAQPPKEKSFEEIIKELQIQYGIPDEEGFAVKDKLGRLGDIVDVQNYPYYGSKAAKGIMNAAEFSVRFPGAAGQLIHDVATGPGWKEQGLDFIKNVSPGWGWSEKVGLDSLIDEQVGAMKERGSSDAPTSLGGVLELGVDIAMPLGYVYGAAKFGKFIKALGQTPDKISDFNKRIIDHLDSTGQSKRDFMTLVGTVGAMGAIKAMGLDKIFNVGKVIKGADDMIPMVKGSYSTMPKWFPMFIHKINPKMIYEGDGMSTFKGTDDFLPDIRVEKNGDDYLVYGKNEYGQDWTVSYEGPRWLEIEAGQKPVYFKGEFEVMDQSPRMMGPEDFDFEPEVIKEIDELLGGNGRSMEEFATGTEIKGLTKGEKQVDWAEGRAQQAMDEAAELEAGVFDEVN